MLWPSSTPDLINLPNLENRKVGSYLRDDKIIDLVLYDGSYMLIILTKKAIYIYRLKPLCPVVVYVRSELSIKGFGENVNVVVKPDGRFISVSTSKSCVLMFEVGDFGLSMLEDDASSIYSFNGGGEVCRFVRADNFVNDGLSELKQVVSSESTSDHGNGNGNSSIDRRTSDTVGLNRSRKSSITSIGERSHDYNSYSRRQSFSDSIIQVYPAPGELIGVRELRVKLVGVVKGEEVDEASANPTGNTVPTTPTPPTSPTPPIISIIPLEDYLMISTNEKTLFYKWSGEKSPTPVYTIYHSDLDWLESGIIHIFRSKPMSLFSITTESGCVYSATLNEINKGSNDKSKPSSMVLKGYILHDSKATGLPGGIFSSINARFSEISVACSNGSIYLYNIRDYSGTSKLLNIVENPSSSNLLSLNWSSDGCALLSGYENGWVLYSVYGMINASSFLIKNEQKEKEPWLGAVKQACWSFSGDSAFLLSKQNQLYLQGFLKWGAVGNWSHENIQRPTLLKESNKLLVYRGQEQPDLTTIDRDALLWLTVTIPGNYIAENWPIKFISSSPDGRYIAIAGVRGFTHYSIYSGKWKLFNDEYMDREISVKSMIWYKHFLIVAVDTDQYKHEIKIYSRELELSNNYVVINEELPTPILKMSIVQDLLLVYGYDNNIYFYRITSITNNEIRSLDLEYKVNLNGIVHSPARVRSINGINDDKVVNGMSLKLTLLIDGMLMVLYPSNNNSYRKHLLHHNIEYYYTISTKKHSMLWAFDGKDMLVWIDIENSNATNPAIIPVESYPLAVLIDKGILTGIETDTMSSRENHFSYFKFWTSTQLFVPFILESILKQGDYEKAVSIANEYKHLKYFSHILEMLLYKILITDDPIDNITEHLPDNANDNSPNDNSLLVKATDLVVQFPQMLDIFLGCTRKIEIKYWSKLFKVIGTPQELFERCILLGKLKTAGGYLLILHSLSKTNYYDGKENTIELFKLAYETGDFDLCKELTRFLTGIDPSLKLLKEIVASVGVPITAK